MKTLKFFFTIFLFASFLQASDIKHVNSLDKAFVQAKKQNKQVILFVYSTHCPWCKRMERTTFKDQEVIDHVNKNFIFTALNRDTDNIPQRFIPYGVPTTYVIDPQTEDKLFTMKGYKNTDSFLGRLKR